MYDSLRTLSTVDFRNEFDNLKPDIELILSKEGRILAVNEIGERFFRDSRNFYDYFTPYYADLAFHYISQIWTRGAMSHFSLLHSIQKKDLHVQYNGIEKGGCILLCGREIQQPRPFELSEILEQFEHAYAIVDENMVVKQSNHIFNKYFTEFSHDHVNSKQNLRILTRDNEGLSAALDLVQEVLETKAASQFEIKNENSGECFRLKAVYLKGTNNVLLMIYDLSFERKYTHLLAYQDQMENVSYLSAGVAHELRNPLSVIKGFLQLSALTDSFHKYSDTILSETDRMNEIIDNFLSVSRKKLKKEWCTPEYLLNSVIDIIRSECLMQGIHFHSNVEPVEGELEVNESSFKQIVLNALRNSIESFPPGERRNVFSLVSCKKEEYLKIELSDNGKGIEKEVLANLGKPFFTTKEKGTGVGIPLCKKIMEEHNGTFDITSTIDEGTTITLGFPLKEAD